MRPDGDDARPEDERGPEGRAKAPRSPTQAMSGEGGPARPDGDDARAEDERGPEGRAKAPRSPTQAMSGPAPPDGDDARAEEERGPEGRAKAPRSPTQAMSELPPVMTGQAALRDRKARRRRQAKLLALGLSTLLALVVGEVVVRVAAPQSSGFDRIYVPDPDTGYRMVPGPHHVAYPIDINAQGLRDVERPVAKPAGARRVVVLGDSFTFAALPVEQGFCRQLGARLAGVDVVNAGVPGWTTWQQAAWLARDGLAYGPDVVVVAVFLGNDVEENLRRGQPPEAKEERGLVRRLTNSSHLYRLFKGLPEELWWRARGDSSRARRYHKIERRRLALFDRGPAAAGFEPGWAVLREELARIVALAKPSPVVALLIPDELQVDPALVRAVCARDGSDPAAFDLDAPQARLARLCGELGLAVVDTLPELRRRTAAGERLYIPLDSHWNEAGNALAADALARQPALAALRQSP